MTQRLPGTDTMLNLKRVFAAPREKVFNAWTNPDLLPRWLGGGEVETEHAEIDLRVGGKYRLTLKPAGGDTVFVSGIYQEISPPERLMFTWTFEQPGEQPVTLVTVDLLDRDGDTEMILYHERFIDIPQRDLHQQGWLLCFDRLAELL